MGFDIIRTTRGELHRIGDREGIIYKSHMCVVVLDVIWDRARCGVWAWIVSRYGIWLFFFVVVFVVSFVVVAEVVNREE